MSHAILREDDGPRPGAPAPTFSLIIIFHNQQQFVSEALESALAQPDDGVEVIAVDDASTDGTRAALSAYADRVTLILLDDNRGMCGARDAGVAVATGDYLAFLDGDDAFLPWAVATYRRVAKLENPVLMMGPMHWFEGCIPPPGPRPERVRYVRYADYFKKDKVIDISASAIVVRQDAMARIGRWAGDGVGDLDLLYRLGTAGTFAQVVAPSTTWHRSHAGQMIRQSSVIVEGVRWIITGDRHGRYPGGDARRFDRRACIGGIVLHWALVHGRNRALRATFSLLLSGAPYVASALIMRTQRTLLGRQAPRDAALDPSPPVGGGSTADVIDTLVPA